MEAVRTENYYTYADYCDWDENERWELIGGAAYAMAPAPSLAHQSVLIRLVRQLGDYLEGKPCKLFAAPTDVRLNADGPDDTVVQPDILIVCDEPKLKDGKAVSGAPDFVIEILSPSTLRHDMITKRDLYQASGVREYWVVDPDSKTVTAHVLHGGRYVSRHYGAQDVAAPVDILEGCGINLTEVFERL